jgi:hypothetical protein
MSAESLLASLKNDQVEEGVYLGVFPTHTYLAAYAECVNRLQPGVAEIHKPLHAIVERFGESFLFAHIAFVATAFDDFEDVRKVIASQIDEHSHQYLRSQWKQPEIFGLFRTACEERELLASFTSVYQKSHNDASMHNIMQAWNQAMEASEPVLPAIRKFCQQCDAAARKLRLLCQPLEMLLEQTDLETHEFLRFETRLHYYFDREPYRSGT